MSRTATVILIFLSLIAICVSVDAYVLLGPKWPNPTTTFYVDIPGANGAWNSGFQEAMSRWTQRTVFSFRSVPSYADPCSEPNAGSSRNGVKFSNTECGEAWGASVLAVTHRWTINQDRTIVQASIVFNGNRTWNVYDGPWDDSVADFRRVAVHELGHSVGLGHEDSVSSIMRTAVSRGSTITTPQADDIDGISALYGTVTTGDRTGPSLSIASPAEGQTVSVSPIIVSGAASDAGRGDNGVASVTVNGARSAGDTASGSSTASWSRSVSLTPGQNVVDVVARDNSPNQNATARTVIINYQTGPTSSGWITASPNPCNLGSRASCAVIISWGTQNIPSAEVRVRNLTVGAGLEFKSGTSGLAEYPDILGSPNRYEFTLYRVDSGSRSRLNSVTVMGTTSPKGVIAASPNPCILQRGSCSTTLTWSTQNVQSAEVRVHRGDFGLRYAGSPMVGGLSGQTTVAWIEGIKDIEPGEFVFTLFQTSSGSRVPLASVSVTGTGEPSYRKRVFIPVVLSAAGINDSHFSSELTLSNRGNQNVTVTLGYTSAFGGGGGGATTMLPPGQRIFPDTIAFLRSLGIPIPSSGNRGGTLRVTFSGIRSSNEVAASVRTTTLVSRGRAGLAYSGISDDYRPSVYPADYPKTIYLFGLRQDSADRSNVAIQNLGEAPWDSDILVRVTVFSGDPAKPVAFTIFPDISLPPGGFYQLSGILASDGIGLSNGYVKVDRVGGTGPFFAYGVINDQAGSDGSYLPPTFEADPVFKLAGWILPVVVEAITFTTELMLANWSGIQKELVLTLVADAITTNNSSASLPITLKPGEQVFLPNFVQMLRDRRIAGVGPAGPAHVGPLSVTTNGTDANGLFVGARVSSPGDPGRNGLFFTATPMGLASTASAWVYGLQQDAENRTNLALVNTGEVDDEPASFRIEIFDGGTGAKVTTVEPVTVRSKRWLQLGSILAQYAPGVTQGYAKVTRVSGINPFIAYAVINDGASPGERSDDGAFIASSP